MEENVIEHRVPYIHNGYILDMITKDSNAATAPIIPLGLNLSVYWWKNAPVNFDIFQDVWITCNVLRRTGSNLARFSKEVKLNCVLDSSWFDKI